MMDGIFSYVAIKVRHQNVLDESYRDLEFFFFFLDNFTVRQFGIPCSKKELSDILRQQLDFNWEAYNLYKLAQNFKNDPSSHTISFVRTDFLWIFSSFVLLLCVHTCLLNLCG